MNCNSKNVCQCFFGLYFARIAADGWAQQYLYIAHGENELIFEPLFEVILVSRVGKGSAVARTLEISREFYTTLQEKGDLFS